MLGLHEEVEKSKEGASDSHLRHENDDSNDGEVMGNEMEQLLDLKGGDQHGRLQAPIGRVAAEAVAYKRAWPPCSLGHRSRGWAASAEPIVIRR